MERKGGSGSVTVTAEEVRAALNKPHTLTTEEERALRMRHGARVDLRAPLPRAAGTREDLADELLLIEMQLLRAQRARSAPAAAPSSSKTKDKIVRALRRKK